MLSPTDTSRYLLFQLERDDRLRGISWDGSISGVLADHVSHWSGQSPDGSRYVAGGIVYDREGHSLGSFPWPGKDSSATWSTNGQLLCKAVPDTPITGARMRLETAPPGQGPRVVAAGYTTYSYNALYPVLACDVARDRAIVAVLGQGVAAARLWVFRLSTGAIIRSVDYSGAGGWVASTADGSILAESVPQGSAGRWTTTIRRADDGLQLGAIDDLVAHGFSGDASQLVGVTGAKSTVLLNWRSGRRVWSSTGLPYGGMLAEPTGNHVAIGLGFTGGSDIADVYIVAPDGSAILMPAHVRAALNY